MPQSCIFTPFLQFFRCVLPYWSLLGWESNHFSFGSSRMYRLVFTLNECREEVWPSAPSTRPSNPGCPCLAIQIHEKFGSVPVLQASLKSLTYSQTDRRLDVGLVRDILARTWKFSGEFSLFLSVVTHWGGSCGQSTEILGYYTCAAALCPDPAHHQVPAGASCLSQVSQHICVCDHSMLTFIPPNNSGKERLDQHFLCLITYAQEPPRFPLTFFQNGSF